MPIGKLVSNLRLRVAVHVVNRDGPVGELVADRRQMWFKEGEGWVSDKACDDLRALLGPDYPTMPSAMVVDCESFDRQILNPCRMSRDNPTSMRFVYSVVPAPNPKVDPAFA